MITDEYYNIISNPIIQKMIKTIIEEYMPYTSDEKQEERRLKSFNKDFDYNATIYRCNDCMTPRKYGHGKPERSMVLILCEGICKKHTWHSYLEIWKSRGGNYAGISDNS